MPLGRIAAVRFPRPSNKPKKEKVYEESEKGRKEASQKSDEVILARHDIAQEALRFTRRLFFIESSRLRSSMEAFLAL
jgi:hypothetical protein